MSEKLCPDDQEDVLEIVRSLRDFVIRKEKKYSPEQISSALLSISLNYSVWQFEDKYEALGFLIESFLNFVQRVEAEEQ